MIGREKEGGNTEALAAWKQQTISWLRGKDVQRALLSPQLCDYNITILTGTLVESTVGAHRDAQPFQTRAYICDHRYHFKAMYVRCPNRDKLKYKTSSK